MDLTNVWEEVNEKLYHFILRKTGDREESKDLLQEVFVKAYTNINSLNCQNKVIPWMYTIARNTINDYYKTRKNQFSNNQLVLEADYDPLENEEKDLTKNFANCLVPMIERLPEIYRDALLLTEIEGLSQKELAKKLGISYSGAKSRVQRGRELLKATLLQCCVICTDSYGNVLGYKARKAIGK